MRYEQIETGFWADGEVAELSALARLLYVWSWTNDHSHGLTGCYPKPSDAIISAETGIAKEGLASCFEELEGAGKVRVVSGWVWVVGRLKRSIGMSPNHDAGIKHRVAELPIDLRELVLARHDCLKNAGFGITAKGLARGLQGAGKPSIPTPIPLPLPTPLPEDKNNNAHIPPPTGGRCVC